MFNGNVSGSASQLNGQLASYYATAAALSDLTTVVGGKLGKLETAADSGKLGGQLPTYYALAAALDEYKVKSITQGAGSVTVADDGKGGVTIGGGGGSGGGIPDVTTTTPSYRVQGAWVDSYMTADTTINITTADNNGTIVAKLAPIPKNLGGHLLKIAIADGTYTDQIALFLQGYTNGQINIWGGGVTTTILKSVSYTAPFISLDNCDVTFSVKSMAMNVTKTSGIRTQQCMDVSISYCIINTTTDTMALDNQTSGVVIDDGTSLIKSSAGSGTCLYHISAYSKALVAISNKATVDMTNCTALCFLGSGARLANGNPLLDAVKVTPDTCRGWFASKSDGSCYVGGGSVQEAPQDGLPYCRFNGGWLNHFASNSVAYQRMTTGDLMTQIKTLKSTYGAGTYTLLVDNAVTGTPVVGNQYEGQVTIFTTSAGVIRLSMAGSKMAVLNMYYAYWEGADTSFIWQSIGGITDALGYVDITTVTGYNRDDISAALTYCQSNGLRRVYFPPTVYTIASNLSLSGIWYFKGDTIDSSFLSVKAGNSLTIGDRPNFDNIYFTGTLIANDLHATIAYIGLLWGSVIQNAPSLNSSSIYVRDDKSNDVLIFRGDMGEGNGGQSWYIWDKNKLQIISSASLTTMMPWVTKVKWLQIVSPNTTIDLNATIFPNLLEFNYGGGRHTCTFTGFKTLALVNTSASSQKLSFAATSLTNTFIATLYGDVQITGSGSSFGAGFQMNGYLDIGTVASDFNLFKVVNYGTTRMGGTYNGLTEFWSEGIILGGLTQISGCNTFNFNTLACERNVRYPFVSDGSTIRGTSYKGSVITLRGNSPNVMIDTVNVSTTNTYGIELNTPTAPTNPQLTCISYTSNKPIDIGITNNIDNYQSIINSKVV